MEMNNNKIPESDNIPCELFKRGSEQLTQFILKLVANIWRIKGLENPLINGDCKTLCKYYSQQYHKICYFVDFKSICNSINKKAFCDVMQELELPLINLSLNAVKQVISSVKIQNEIHI